MASGAITPSMHMMIQSGGMSTNESINVSPETAQYISDIGVGYNEIIFDPFFWIIIVFIILIYFGFGNIKKEVRDVK